MRGKQGQELKEFNRLYKELGDIYHEIALKAGMSDSAFVILYAIIELGDGCLQKDIAERYFISRQTVNSSVKKLEAKGYILPKKGKGRDMHLYLTDEGQRLVKDKIVPIIDIENSIFEEMLPGESREFLRLTEKYVALYRKKLNLML